ncbi:MAG: DNRLRE domain-containing protein [Verrucomicrobiales bacterium]|nr:DNRLRE domain-containing protein [Verrucomicrobiales bacterium]
MTLIRRAAAAVVLLFGCTLLRGAVTQDFVVDLKATVSTTAPHIVLSWTQRVQSNITAQKIHRRLKGETTWVKLADLTTTQTSYTDTTATVGVEYEYWMERTLSGLTPNTAMGYLSAGVEVPEVQDRGTLLLLIDDTMEAPLAPEIDQLKADLAADGWTVQSITAPRGGTAISTKALVSSAYSGDPAGVKQVYVLGHVPVPYSGRHAPDGHSNHVGAWAADGYYGEMDGTWTDTTVNTTTPARDENDNVPGDGKFDQTTFPSLVELGVGRVDMYRLGRSPSAISATPEVEISLLRRYLNKAHEYRHKIKRYAAIPRRTLIRDGFGHAFSSEPFAVTAWAGAYGVVGHPPASAIDAAPSYTWFTPTYAGGQDYLWGHGCGGGSYQSANSFGNSSDFGHKTSRVVFTTLFGSYHGDWDSDSNLMRSALAGNPDGDSLSLCCFWQGRPNYFVHSLGMGETLGHMTRESMNAGMTGGGSYVPGGSSFRGTHVGLLGDPALRMHQVEPPRRLAARSLSGQVELSWAASTESGLQGYHVYRAATVAGPFVKLTATPQAGTTYTDTTVTPGSSYAYLVRTLKLDDVPGGSYFNLSVGSGVAITASGAASSPPLNPTELVLVSQTSSTNAQLAWQDNASDETNYRVERKVNAGGAWTPLSTLPANATSFTDNGPFTHLDAYFYRVIALNAAGDSPPSNVESFEASAGFIEMSERVVTADKSAGTVTVMAKRFGGATGAVTVNFATSNSVATAGTHYTSQSSSLTWADGEAGEKPITITLANTASPQQERQFFVTLTSPGNGARLGVFNRTSVLIQDASATLSAPWSQLLLGAAASYPYGTTAYSGEASDAEGFLGSTMIGGRLSSGGTTDSGRFIYQEHSGDGTLTAYVRTSLPSHSNSRLGLMVRASTASNAKMAGVMANSSTSTTGYGTRLVYRSGTTMAETPTSTNQLVTPCWLRLTRLGDLFLAEHSTDGTTWTGVGQATVAGIPATASWGLFGMAGAVALSSDYSANYQLGGFETVSFGGVPVPTTPDGVTITTVSNSSVTLQWNTQSFTASYLVQRRAEGEHFTTVATVTANASSPTQSITDAIDGDSAYEYRVIAANSAGESAPSAVVSVVTPPGDVEISLTPEADATVYFADPNSNFGASDVVTVGGTDPVDSDLSTSAKSYLRFNMAGLPTGMKSAQLRLTHVANRLLAEAGYYYMSTVALTDDASDAWNEGTLTWTNAPQNDTAGVNLLAPTSSLGFGFLSTLPAAGGASTFSMNLANLQSSVGANDLLTLVCFGPFATAQVDWASKEHASFDAPTLRMTFTNPLPRRPGFLTVIPGTGSSLVLNWIDGADDETGFTLERRAANGEWMPLTSLPPNSTTHTDSTALPGVIYEYRIRASNSFGDSEWTVAASSLRTPAALITDAVISENGTTATGAGAPPNNSYVPTSLQYFPAVRDFVTDTTLSTSALRNNATTWRGFQFTTGANPIVIHELARWVLSGNTQQHGVRIVDAATKLTVPGAEVQVDTAGAAVGYKYAPLAAPVTLPAGTAFYLVSEEFNGGDTWYEGNCTLTCDSSVASIDQSVWSDSSGTVFTLNNGPNNSYIPVAFRYSDVPVPFATGHGMTRLRNDLTAWLGMEIEVGADPMKITHLGRWVAPGNSSNHSMRVVNAGGGIVAAALVPTTGIPAGQFSYTALASPVTLDAGAVYYVLSRENAGGDLWYDFATAAPGTATPYQLWLLAHGLPMDASGAGSAVADPASDGLPNLIKYALGLDPAVTGHGGRLSYGTLEDAGNTYLTLTYTRPEPAPPDLSYTVEASPDLSPASWTSATVVGVSSIVNGSTRTITVRATPPMTGGNRHFLHLKVTQ